MAKKGAKKETPNLQRRPLDISTNQQLHRAPVKRLFRDFLVCEISSVLLCSSEEWTAALATPGLLLVDVYRSWTGPCEGVARHIDKIKQISYASACSDSIPELSAFRANCQPVFLLILDGSEYYGMSTGSRNQEYIVQNFPTSQP